MPCKKSIPMSAPSGPDTAYSLKLRSPFPDGRYAFVPQRPSGPAGAGGPLSFFAKSPGKSAQYVPLEQG
ncbi:hypothetical protein BACCAP_00937 [Pseudoflavonifractor capillosus ATCC 29799]|uniref:Uncharacterized protein n=1 Tax=Pseudoflavonifractor capillosus ATCC 29799 TaxID=411467 RepID=A6NRV9_9FIRM|nr:hypothetical protein BACCAP_00937 [Pseudoflavonifractor capillosus ATCC 29799]